MLIRTGGVSLVLSTMHLAHVFGIIFMFFQLVHVSTPKGPIRVLFVIPHWSY